MPVGVLHPESSGVTAPWWPHTVHLEVQALTQGSTRYFLHSKPLTLSSPMEPRLHVADVLKIVGGVIRAIKSQPDFDDFRHFETERKGGRIKIRCRTSVEIY